MMPAARWASLFGMLACANACARDVAVGHEDALTSGVRADGGADALGAGGANALEPSTGAPSMGGANDEALWSAQHEVASFGEWLGDGKGIQYVQGTGKLELTSEQAHAGSLAFVASIDTNDGELHQAMMGRNISLLEGRYGAWYFLPEAPRADYWVIMKLSNGSSTDRFDIDIEALESEAPRLRLFEHPNTWISEPAGVAFPVGRWVHVEVLYKSTPDSDGRLVVLQDGERVLDTGLRSTANDNRVTFYCGSASRSVSPTPFRLFIDDASITLP